MGRARESENRLRSREENSGLAFRLVRACGGWIGKLRGRDHVPPRLTLVERIALAPHQSLALVEAEGRRLLVATSPEGAPAFYALDEKRQAKVYARASRFNSDQGRVSW